MNPLIQYAAYEFLSYPSTSSTSDRSPFSIKHTSTWTYCGPLLTPSSLPLSLHTWSTAAVSSPSVLLSRLLPLLTFLHTFLSNVGVQHYWLTLRATRPTNEYDVPRWHVDDDFFAALSSLGPEAPGGRNKKRAGRKESKGGWKVCTTLLGPSTLFLPLARNDAALRTLREVRREEAAKRIHSCTSIRCAGCFDTGAAVRSALSTLFADEEVVQAREDEVVFFRTGEEMGAVHSEPPCGAHRVFVNVVPGTEGELRRLMGRFGMVFPRAWSLGVPTGLDGVFPADLEEEPKA